MKIVSSALGLVALMLVGGLGAQDYAAPGGWFGGAGYHSSTAEEGMARGMADLTRSAGAANLMNSEAAKNYETARRQNMENRVFGTDAYFDMRRINRDARAVESGPRPSMDDLARFARARAPSRLSVSELDPLTGRIDWPPILRDPRYAAARQAVEEAFQARAQAGYLTASQQSQVRQAGQYLNTQLQSNINAYAPQDYAQAKQFLRGLNVEMLAQAG